MSLFSFSKKREPKAAAPSKSPAEADDKKDSASHGENGCCGGCGGSGHPPKSNKSEQDASHPETKGSH